nr:hypothetical protein [Bradyrhizobium sp. CCBAU 53415]
MDTASGRTASEDQQAAQAEIDKALILIAGDTIFVGSVLAAALDLQSVLLGELAYCSTQGMALPSKPICQS